MYVIRRLAQMITLLVLVALVHMMYTFETAGYGLTPMLGVPACIIFPFLMDIFVHSLPRSNHGSNSL